ncbi:DUF6221 family protein [Streptomonospora litoralis]|uniref:Uncharacterized protein n=1 Tax=Streptomonospora litoralis TaxID=2498135 RepID=A0A4P6Q7N6_9ACTN|nr:DUF6221 family protein [Streptomonospora litoralis]QBI56755.1 hypothetical protein EKD16_25070 [Streptomonospora litoralis]
MTITEFLNARLHEEQQWAIHLERNARNYLRAENLREVRGRARQTTVAWDPYAEFAQRVYRSVTGQLRILEEHPQTRGWDGDGVDNPICETCARDDRDGGQDGDPYPCTTLRLLALPYADHPHYQQEWAP